MSGTATKENPSSQLTSEQADRLWQHGLHEDNVFNDRINFFLVIEAILLGSVATLFGQISANGRFVLLAFIAFGFILTLIWWYVSARHMYVLEGLRKRAREVFPEYAATRTMREGERERKRWLVSANWLLAHAVPVIFILIWVVLFIVALL
jgi:hypothetical protein